MPSAAKAAAGLAISSALKAGSRQALAMILPNSGLISGIYSSLKNIRTASLTSPVRECLSIKEMLLFIECAGIYFIYI